MTRLELVRLIKRFGDVTAVDEVSLSVAPGSLVALLGPSGCGKTTTLRMIAGLEQPTDGDIRFNDQSVLHLPPDKRNIGMVFQRYVLFPHMNVAANVGFGLRMRGTAKAEIAKRVAEVLEIVQLTGFEKRFPSQLSGGQQQRVAIARTVITNPKVMLMDEPLSNLDAKLREEMRSFITNLQRRLNITTLFVTHDQVEAIELADRIGVMFDGRLVQFGSPEEIFNRPRTPRIADFMGATNTITGRLVEKGADASALETALGVLRVHHAPPQPRGATVVATIRPEHIDLQPADGQTRDNLYNARIANVVYYGGTLSYRVSVGELELQVKDRSMRRFIEGEEVQVRIDPEHVWIFPETQGGASGPVDTSRHRDAGKEIA
jgi:putative spermidine/putrescine transport system ATP-binding protein